MPLTNPLTTYDAIAANTKIAFKAGTQADLNTMILNGGATEGTFYLTIDTHKLYVGRRKTTGGQVYPEQVSRGVTVVGTSSELPIPAPTDAPSGAIEEGELFYITNENVLAALRIKRDANQQPVSPLTYEWVQINPPTGISSVSTATTDLTGSVNVKTIVATGGGDKTGGFQVVAGNNITLTGTNDASIGLGADGTLTNQGKLTISATDTTYKAGIETNANKGVLGLKSNSNSTLDNPNKIDIVGSGTVAVESGVVSGTDTISVKGPTFSSIGVLNHGTNGFIVSLEGFDGAGNAFSGISGTIQPQIAYGHGSSGQSTAGPVSFANGTATLDVYTAAETDAKITSSINTAIQAADAMTYRGTVAGATDFYNTATQNGIHNGDTYKVSGAGGAGNEIIINNVTADVGDLIIINGALASPAATETNGVITGINNISALEDICELVPSGDEPEVDASVSASANGSTANRIEIFDGKNSANTNILTATFSSGNKIKVIGSDQGNVSDGDILQLTFNHEATTRTDSVTQNLTTSSDTDTIQQSKVKLFVLDGAYTGTGATTNLTGLKTDSYGHVTGIEGKVITFEHNYITAVTPTYGSSSSNITLSLEDSIGRTEVGTLRYASSTLQIKGGKQNPSDATENRLEIDLVWGTF